MLLLAILFLCTRLLALIAPAEGIQQQADSVEVFSTIIPPLIGFFLWPQHRTRSVATNNLLLSLHPPPTVPYS
jgi:hypothetical protein